MAIIGTRDEFDGTNYTEIDSANWTFWNYGTVATAINYFNSGTSQGANTNVLYRWTQSAFDAHSGADYEVRTEIKRKQYASTSIRIWLRTLLTPYTGYYLEFTTTGASAPVYYSVKKRVSGSDTTLKSSTSLGVLSHDVYFPVVFRAVGSDLTVDFNGSQIWTGTDASSPLAAKGAPALRFEEANDWQYNFFEVYEASGSALTVAPIPDQSLTVGSAFTLNVTDYASGGTSPYGLSTTLVSGSLPTGITVNVAEDGTFSGTPSVYDETGTAEVQVYDSAGTPATFDISFNWQTNAAQNDPPTFTGTIPDFQFTQGQAATPLNYDLNAHFSDADAFTIAANTPDPWLAGCGASVVAGILTWTKANFAEGTYPLTVKATDTGSNVTPSNTFTVTVLAPSSNIYSVTTSPLVNGAGSLRTSLAVSWIWYPTDPSTAQTAGTEVKGTGTTNATTGTLTTTSTLPAGAGWILVYTAGFASVYMEALTAA